MNVIAKADIKHKPNLELTNAKLQKIINRHSQGDIDFAKKAYQELLDDGQKNAALLSNLASIHIAEKDYLRALELLKEAVLLEPDHVEAILKMGCTIELARPDLLEQAINSYRKVLSIKPDHGQAYFVLGSALFKQGHVDQAIESYQQSVKFQANSAIAHFNLGNLYMVRDRIPEAINSFKTAYDLNNSLGGALGKYWHLRMKICDWSDYPNMNQSLLKTIKKLIKKNNTADVTNSTSPFSLLNIYDDPGLHLSTAKKYTLATTNVSGERDPLHRQHKKPLNKIIKVAFLSADYYDHATSFLMAELFELFDKNKFEIHVISFGRTSSKDSIMRQRIESSGVFFYDVVTKSDDDIAQLIRLKDIDIAVDLKGYTSESRPAILAERPAPIQVNFLAYPGSMGASFIDYIVADHFVIPAEQERHYSEKIMYMPNSYQINDRKRAVDPNTPDREECGLPKDAFVYCCFNHCYKITPDVFDVWMQLLEETPDSVLWLLKSNQWANENLLKEAQLRGIDPARLIFAEKMSSEKHLARIQNADLFLDTFPCNAHTTASDALWVGLPLITLSGKGFATRVAGSLLKAVDMPELITSNLKDYKKLALDLAQDPTKLSALKSKLIKNRDTCSLFDSETFKNDIQRGFKHMVDLFENDMAAETFSVSDLSTENKSEFDYTNKQQSAIETAGPAINIAMIRPQNYSHSDAFNEVAETLLDAFRNLGFITNITENTLIEDSINIILGANLLEEADLDMIPNSSIIYNFEQITDDSEWMTDSLFKAFERFHIWDYSEVNIAALRARGIKKHIQHVPVGYSANLSRIPKADVQDIDVLFYGSINQRRQDILEKLKKSGLKVETLFDVYGEQRDAYIARSKVIVNIHFYDSNVFEQVRVSYLLANQKAVVCECANISEVDKDLRDAVALVSYEEIVDKCCELVKSENQRNALELKGFEAIKTRNQEHYIEQALSALGQSQSEDITYSAENVTSIPSKINIGSGKDFKEDYLNIDISPNSNPDVVADLSDPDLFEKSLNSKRFSTLILMRNQFEQIIANDVLEHIPDLVNAMTNCLDLLKVGGQMIINVPYDLSYGAWQDPTHVRAFNERSWLYYTDWYWYLGWQEARFDLSNIDFTLSPSGLEMQQQGKNSDEILAQPRAVDSMSVILTKRLLTAEEQSAGQQRMAGA